MESTSADVFGRVTLRNGFRLSLLQSEIDIQNVLYFSYSSPLHQVSCFSIMPLHDAYPSYRTSICACVPVVRLDGPAKLVPAQVCSLYRSLPNIIHRGYIALDTGLHRAEPEQCESNKVQKDNRGVLFRYPGSVDILFHPAQGSQDSRGLVKPRSNTSFI